MKKKWIAAELVTTDICETAASGYCLDSSSEGASDAAQGNCRCQ